MNSLPTDFVNKMKNHLAEEFDDFINSYDKPRAFGLRANTLKISTDDFVKQVPFKLNRIPWTSDGFIIPPTVNRVSIPIMKQDFTIFKSQALCFLLFCLILSQGKEY